MIAFAVSLLLAAQAPADTGSIDCVRIDASPPGATVALERGVRRSALAPAVFCDLRVGSTWRLSVSHPGWETRSARVRLDASGRLHVRGDRLSRLARALVVPGWGLAAAGDPAAAGMTFVSTLVTGLDAVGVLDDWEAEKRRRDAAAAVLEPPGAGAADYAEASRRVLTADAYRDRALGGLALAGWWHLGGVVTAVYRSQPPRVERLEGGGYRASVPRRSGLRAALQSALWPGAGQFYRGHPERGVVLQGAFVAAGIGAMDTWLRFRLRDIEYDAAREDIPDTGDPAVVEAARARARRLWDDRERMRRRTLAWTGAAAAVWLASVVDAALSDSGSSLPARFAVETTWRGGTLYQGIRVALP